MSFYPWSFEAALKRMVSPYSLFSGISRNSSWNRLFRRLSHKNRQCEGKYAARPLPTRGPNGAPHAGRQLFGNVQAQTQAFAPIPARIRDLVMMLENLIQQL